MPSTIACGRLLLLGGSVVMSIEIGVLLAVVGTIVAVLGYSLNKANSSTAEANLLKQEASENASSNAKLQADVRYIRDSIDRREGD